MTVSKRQIALFRVAARKLDLSEAETRAALVEIAGVTSVKDLDREGFDAIMGFFEYLGFAPMSAKGTDFGARPGMASFAQLELIRMLRREYTRFTYGAAEDQLNKWLMASLKRSSLRFVTAADARKIITALKAMKQRSA